MVDMPDGQDGKVQSSLPAKHLAKIVQSVLGILMPPFLLHIHNFLISHSVSRCDLLSGIVFRNSHFVHLPLYSFWNLEPLTCSPYLDLQIANGK